MSQAYDPASGVAAHARTDFLAIWDTGATGTLVTQKVIDDCGLVATGMTNMHGVSGPGVAETFLVNIYLPNNVGYANMRVAKGEFTGGDILIGMNIIGTGDFAITNPGGVTQFSFRVPSQADICFVKQTNLANARAAKSQKKGPSNRGGQKHRRPKSQRKNKGKRKR